MRASLQWILWPPNQICSVSDQFCVDTFQLKLQGDSLQLEFEVGDKDAVVSACQIAQRYVQALQSQTGLPLRLVSIEEFASMPAYFQTVIGPSSTELRRLTEAIRTARNEVLAESDDILRRCYDYLQDAVETQDSYLIPLYKLVESMKHAFKNENEVDRTLHVKKEMKTITKLANEPSRDQRHAPKRASRIQRPSPQDRNDAIECARIVVRAYEQYVVNLRRTRILSRPTR